MLDSILTFLGFGWCANPKFTEEGHFFQASVTLRKAWDTPPIWSPDGSKIAFVVSTNDIAQLEVINADGSNPSNTWLGLPEYLVPNSFHWSPDGSQILFQSFKGPAVGIIYVANVGGKPLALTDRAASSPAWSPDGSRIAFVSGSNHEIYVMNADGSNPIQLTQNSAWEIPHSLVWSPGGSKIAFLARTGVDEHIYRLNANGSNLTRLTNAPEAAYLRIAWASSSVSEPEAAATKPASALAESCDKFAFVSTDAGRTPGVDYRKYAFGVLFVKNINGSDMFALSDNVSWNPGDSPRIVWSPDGKSLAFESGVANFITVSKIETPDFIEIRDDAYPRLNAPAWSPDSRKIAFSFGDEESMEIGVTNAAGGTITNLTRNPADDQKPAWSPDGRKIAFLSTRDGIISDLYVMNANGSSVTRLTQDLFVESFPVWSPDGSKIAFSDGNDIYVVNANGSGLNNLTLNSVKNNSPVWSPDGLRIAFESHRQGNAEIYVMNADGSNVLNLTKHPANDKLPVWSPDGSKILFQIDRDGKSEIYIMNANSSNPINLTNRPDYLNESPVCAP